MTSKIFSVKDQVITDRYSIYNSDNMYVLPILPDESIDLSVYSPPFAKKNGGALYHYSSSENDLSNCESLQQFLTQYGFTVAELSRVHKPGTITAVHCTDTMDTKTEVLFDFPHEIIKLHEQNGFEYKNRITVWKEPLKVRMRTMVRSLMHKMIVDDSSKCFTASPDYVLIFKKKGEREKPVTHPSGLNEYYGKYPLLIEHFEDYGLQEDIKPSWNPDKKIYSMTDAIDSYVERSFKALQKKYAGWEDPKTNKLSHIVWQRYASSVWDDVRIDNVLPFRDAKEEDDERHVHPLQLDVIGRITELYSLENEIVITPYMGVGSEVYEPVKLNRRGIGIELKETYYKQAVANMATIKDYITARSQLSLL
jgi:DNA modification methylase